MVEYASRRFRLSWYMAISEPTTMVKQAIQISQSEWPPPDSVPRPKV